MINGRDIVVFGDDWGHYPSTIQHLGRVLARRNRLLWVGSLGLRRPRLSTYDLLRLLRKGGAIVRGSGTRVQIPGVEQIHPLVIPFHDAAIVRRINTQMLQRTLRARMRALHVHDPLLLAASPIVGDLMGTLGETSSHYICLDDWSQFDRAFECLGRLEQELLSRVDSCFAVTERLLASRRSGGGEDHLLPQGVDTQHFSHGKHPVPPQLLSLRRPIIGFFGLLASFTDLDLLVETARRNPDATVLVIGRRTVDLRSLERIPNLLYVGEVPYERLPAYAQTFDVGLIPFVINELTIAANPLKLLEYLSLGIPVVATDLPALHQFSNVVAIARSRDEFPRLVTEALRRTAAAERETRRSVAARHSWENVAEMLSEVIARVESCR